MATRKKRTKKRSTTRGRNRANRAASRRRSGNVSRGAWGWFKFLTIRLVLLVLVVMVVGIWILDHRIREQFEGQRWAVPAHVYTRPMDIFVGQGLTRDELLSELRELGYRSAAHTHQVGTYAVGSTAVEVFTRPFIFWDGPQQSERIRVEFSGARVRSVHSDGTDIGIFRLEPRLFGSVSPVHHEDRNLVRLEDVPQSLVDALLAIEDRKFYSHPGIDPMAIARAAAANIAAGRVVQGGSTLTQQLVKNYYLDAGRTFQRKFTEMIMAILLEVHYSKAEILQAYLNEVYLGQSGNRAIHGFGLGSQFMYGRPPAELSLAETALLAGIVRGPSYYNPRRHPERAEARRNLVLTSMAGEGFITELQAAQARQQPLGIDDGNASSARSYPAYMDFVRQQLRNDYYEEDLRSEGLRIFTTLDPRIQSRAEQAVTEQLDMIEGERRLEPGSLEAAVVVVRTDNGELAALVGGRRATFAGYNRAMDSIRPIGSLIKPLVYLTALEQPDQYTLATLIYDEPITVRQPGSADWNPGNYDKKSHGPVMLIDALANSYNLATVRIGMDVGVSRVEQTLRRLGYSGKSRLYPSMLLGAIPMSPLDVSDVYLAIAAGGFRAPLKSIRSVLSSGQFPLARYPLSIEQVIEPDTNALITYAMQEVVRSGTARSVGRWFSPELGLAGKTGTTDGYRDSWYVGFSGNYLAVVWVGRDDNASTGLSGASGAARVWSAVMRGVDLTPLHVPMSDQVVTTWVDPSSGQLAGAYCDERRELPFLKNHMPQYNADCGPVDIVDSRYPENTQPVQVKKRKFRTWLRDIFQ